MATTHPAADFSQATWLKSSRSSANGACVEVAANPAVTAHATWRKSSHSSGTGACVEVAADPAVIAIRDSKAPSNPHLTLSARNWASFLADVKHGRHDLGL